MTITSDRPTTPKRVVLRQKVARTSRWLHIYLSMVSFAIVLFFAVTGLTLNHPEWFDKDVRTAIVKGAMPTELLRKPDDLHIVEYLRDTHGIHGSVGEVRTDESEITVSFRAPGYTADATIARTSGRYEVVETRNGFWAAMNDLHKGRDTGKAWKGLIDVSAVLLTLVSVTGLALIFFLYKKRAAGLLVATSGFIACLLLYRIFVP